MSQWKDKGIEDVPDTSPDTDGRCDNDKLGEETVTDECADMRVLSKPHA